MSCLIIIINTIAPVKGCLVLGPRISILTSYLESAGLSWFHHPLSSNCCDNVQKGSIVGTKNLKFLKIHSWLMEKSHYYLTSCKNLESSNFFHKVHTSFWGTQSQSASPVISSLSLSQPSLFQKKLLQVYITTTVPCSRCDFAMFSGERDSQILGFPYLLCYAAVGCNFPAIAQKPLTKI